MHPQTAVVPVPPSTAPITPEDLLTEREVADRLRVSEKTLQNWRWAGEGGPRAIKLGKRAVRYRRADVEAFIEAGLTGKAV